MELDARGRSCAILISAWKTSKGHASRSKKLSESQGTGRPPGDCALLFLPEEIRPRREREDKPGLVEVDSALHAVVSSAEKSWARMRSAEGLVIWSDRISGEASEGRRKYRLRLLVLWGVDRNWARGRREALSVTGGRLCCPKVHSSSGSSIYQVLLSTRHGRKIERQKK